MPFQIVRNDIAKKDVDAVVNAAIPRRSDGAAEWRYTIIACGSL